MSLNADIIISLVNEIKTLENELQNHNQTNQ